MIFHRLDYQGCGLANLGNPDGYVARQVHGWSKRYRDARTDDVPDFETVMAWLSAGMPPDYSKPALVHNDYKLDNVVLDPTDSPALSACSIGRWRPSAIRSWTWAAPRGIGLNRMTVPT